MYDGPDLKPCPFCGGEAQPEFNRQYTDSYWIECGRGCGTIRKTSEYGWTRVGEDWNRRADDVIIVPPAGEYRIEAKPYFLHRRCECGGEMVATGEALLTAPPRYPHRCDKCGNEETISGKKFPRLEYVEA